MTNLVVTKAPEIKTAIDKASRVLVHFHPSPDFDSVGGALAMAQVFIKWGKAVTVIKGDSELPTWIKSVPGYELVTEQSFLETNLEPIDLFVSLDAGSLGQITKRGPVKFPGGLTVVVIDHHASNEGYGQINLVDTQYPATCQILFDLFKLWNVTFDHDIATCLLLGIHADTGGFRHPPTNQTTFLAAAELVAQVPDFSRILFNAENQNEPATLRFNGLMLTSVKTYCQDHVALATARYADLMAQGIEPRHTQLNQMPTRLISVIGWEIGASLIEREPGKISVSLRTRDAERYDVSRVAAVLGGGGHRAAAGILIEGTIETAQEQLLHTIQELYPDLAH